MAENNEGDPKEPVIVNNANGGGDDPVKAVAETQEQFDAMVKERIERATAKAISDVMSQLGIEDIEQARQDIADGAKLKEEQMSELEKAQAQTDEALQQAVQAKADMETMQAKTDEALLKAAIISKASTFNDPMDAWQFVDKSKIESSEDGSYIGIDDALKVLVEAKPYLIKAESNGNLKLGTPLRASSKTVAERLLEKSEQPTEKSSLNLRF